MATARAALGEADFAATWETGRALPLDEAMALATSPAEVQKAPSDGTPAQVAGLSVRELEVLQLLGLGRSNPEIAEALYVSRATARTHVGNVLAKLGVHSRAEAVAVAHRRGLLGPDALPAT